MAISGNVAIAGSDTNDHAGTNSGAAYLFDVATGSELFKLTASDAAAGDIFGHSVVIDGNRAIVSALGNDDAGDHSGAVYLFDVTTGSELLKLTASDAAAGDRFGHGMAISGNRAIIGSYLDDDVGNSSGSAYVFDVTTGEELVKLTASDGAAGDYFGYWTAISGNIAIIGAQKNDAEGSDSGSAYVFDVTTGSELFKLTASDAAAGDRFGYAVAIDGNLAIVGSHLDDDAGSNSGSAYVFDVTTGEQLLKLTASDPAERDEFGRSVAISGHTALISSEYDDDTGSDSGSAYLFDLTFGDELGKLTASDAAAGDLFSTAVAIGGNMGLAGAVFHDNSNGDDVGQAYAFDLSTIILPGADFNDDDVVDDADLLIWEISFANRHFNGGDQKVDGIDFLLWQRSFQPEILLDESPANLDQQGPVGNADLLVWQQAYAVDDAGDVDSDGDTDGTDFLEFQREFTPYEAADVNHDRLVNENDLAGWEAVYGWVADADEDGDLDGDANGDGIVSELDFLWWQKQSTAAAPLTTSAQVPEPASCILLSELLIACLVGCRYRCWLR